MWTSFFGDDSLRPPFLSTRSFKCSLKEYNPNSATRMWLSAGAYSSTYIICKNFACKVMFTVSPYYFCNLNLYLFSLQSVLQLLLIERMDLPTACHPSVNTPIVLFIRSITPPLISTEPRRPSLLLEAPWVAMSPVVPAFLQWHRMRPSWNVCLSMR